MKRQRYHHGNLREALIAATVELVEEHGPSGVSMREAARRAGVSPGAPFRHFRDKNELMVAVSDEGAARLVACLMEAYNAGSAPADRFRAMGIAYVKFGVDHPGHFRVLHMPEYASPQWQVVNDNTQGLIRTLIEEGQRAGTIRPGDPADMMLAAHALVYGLARMFVDRIAAHQGISDDEAAGMADRVTAILGTGMLPTPPNE